MLAPLAYRGCSMRTRELAVARAAQSLGIPQILSTVSSKPLEGVAEAIGDVPALVQLYWPKDPDLAVSFVTRAERAGYSAHRGDAGHLPAWLARA